ncbi:nucleotidyltransferase [Virgibacillus sp. C22-A2]|uniref:tRNA(Met) cytidine acetate ligase n=1 Tax=Virgibacillus tibetensis TaxID=3042313 RepID=A0ABU6KCL0_9BACI|nr:nucleotidyltransferase [Virgibacillus sp. C22-A2]
MKACGLIVEYNPFHNGHMYHIQEAKKISNADCMIAVMSGSFLQRGEPAVIDKFHRAQAALQSGIDIVLELPYPFAVQSSNLFAKGSVQTLFEIGVSSICFGSESGDISNFTTTYKMFKEKETIYQQSLKIFLNKGLSFPEASKQAYMEIGLTPSTMDLTQPNNILGFSYVKAILDKELPITPLTIKRSSSNYHDDTITSSIASATSIRKELISVNHASPQIARTVPEETYRQLLLYKHAASIWHSWEHYFSLVHYRVMTMSVDELAAINGVDEGLEYRIKKTAIKATSFNEWIQAIKTKRYTWTRLQRMFVHILTNTKKTDMEIAKNTSTVPYVRLLGLTKNGQAYLNTIKKEMSVPIISKISRNKIPMLSIEEKASNAYYSILSPVKQQKLRQQEFQPPIRI